MNGEDYFFTACNLTYRVRTSAGNATKLVQDGNAVTMHRYAKPGLYLNGT